MFFEKIKVSLNNMRNGFPIERPPLGEYKKNFSVGLVFKDYDGYLKISVPKDLGTWSSSPTEIKGYGTQITLKQTPPEYIFRFNCTIQEFLTEELDKIQMTKEIAALKDAKEDELERALLTLAATSNYIGNSSYYGNSELLQA